MKGDPMTRVVVLDVDGTLMDTNYLHVEAWARALEEAGCRTPRVEIHKQIGRGSGQLVKEFVGDYESTIEKVQERHGDIYDELQHYGHPLPGAKDLISSLVERGYGVWLVTSATPEELERHQEVLETEGRIAGVVESSEVENSKPAPDVFELALKKSGASADETVSVGDSIWDVKAAEAAGIRTVAVLTGGAFDEAALKAVGAVAVYDDCAALLESNFPE